jgi:hypothetical protein
MASGVKELLEKNDLISALKLSLNGELEYNYPKKTKKNEKSSSESSFNSSDNLENGVNTSEIENETKIFDLSQIEKEKDEKANIETNNEQGFVGQIYDNDEYKNDIEPFIDHQHYLHFTEQNTIPHDIKHLFNMYQNDEDEDEDTGTFEDKLYTQSQLIDTGNTDRSLLDDENHEHSHHSNYDNYIYSNVDRKEEKTQENEINSIDENKDEIEITSIDENRELDENEITSNDEIASNDENRELDENSNQYEMGSNDENKEMDENEITSSENITKSNIENLELDENSKQYELDSNENKYLQNDYTESILIQTHVLNQSILENVILGNVESKELDEKIDDAFKIEINEDYINLNEDQNILEYNSNDNSLKSNDSTISSPKDKETNDKVPEVKEKKKRGRKKKIKIIEIEDDQDVEIIEIEKNKQDSIKTNKQEDIDSSITKENLKDEDLISTSYLLEKFKNLNKDAIPEDEEFRQIKRKKLEKNISERNIYKLPTPILTTDIIDDKGEIKLSYCALQIKMRELGLPANGNRSDLEKRLLIKAEEEEEYRKIRKKELEKIKSQNYQGFEINESINISNISKNEDNEVIEIDLKKNDKKDDKIEISKEKSNENIDEMEIIIMNNTDDEMEIKKINNSENLENENLNNNSENLKNENLNNNTENLENENLKNNSEIMENLENNYEIEESKEENKIKINNILMYIIKHKYMENSKIKKTFEEISIELLKNQIEISELPKKVLKILNDEIKKSKKDTDVHLQMKVIESQFIIKMNELQKEEDLGQKNRVYFRELNHKNRKRVVKRFKKEIIEKVNEINIFSEENIDITPKEGKNNLLLVMKKYLDNLNEWKERIHTIITSSETEKEKSESDNILKISDCSICWSDLYNGEEIYTLNECSHCYHLECISKILSSRSVKNKCTKCFKKISEKEIQKIQNLANEYIRSNRLSNRKNL